MNRLTAAGIVEAAQAGDRVLVVTGFGIDRTLAFDEIARLVPRDELRRTVRTAGEGLIDLSSGGWVKVHTATSTRGVAADVVYIDASVGREALMELPERLLPCVAASPRGEIIRP
jgi:hypothetical protein